MKLMTDPDLTSKVMSKLGQVPQTSQAPPSPPPESQEAPEINNLLDAARYTAALNTCSILICAITWVLCLSGMCNIYGKKRPAQRVVPFQ